MWKVTVSQEPWLWNKHSTSSCHIVWNLTVWDVAVLKRVHCQFTPKASPGVHTYRTNTLNFTILCPVYGAQLSRMMVPTYTGVRATYHQVCTQLFWNPLPHLHPCAHRTRLWLTPNVPVIICVVCKCTKTIRVFVIITYVYTYVQVFMYKLLEHWYVVSFECIDGLSSCVAFTWTRGSGQRA